MRQRENNPCHIGRAACPAPKDWGPASDWRLPNGLTRTKAKEVIRAWCVLTHDRRTAARILGVGEGAIGVYMSNSDTIPPHVGSRIDTLAKILRKKFPREKEVFNRVKLESAENDENERT